MSEAVQQIKDRLSIVDVVSSYVELHKAGKNFKGKSPFSAEKTPSFYVSPDRGMYYCFSTSQGGDMFTFVQTMEGVDFKEALKILAQKAGVELVAEDPKKKTERERWYAALQDATAFYVDALDKETAAKEYLNRRGVKKETLQKWQIGFAPGPPTHGWRVVKDHLEAKGYSRNELLKVGLIKTTEGGKEPFDVFRDRIMFPMSDQNGKVVAFSGRILSKDTEAPKYVNSPETELYKKSELLFGYDKAKQGIRHLDFSLIVEGQFDVVLCHQAGYNNTVAVSGTALTLHHVQLLERLSNRVVLALDADRAGIAAMKRAADLMLRRGMDVKVAIMPDGKDPADMVQSGVGEFKTIVGHAVHVIEFLLLVLKKTITNERSLKLKAREEVLPFILLLPSRIDQEHFVSKVAESIGTTVDAVRFEIERLREQGDTPVRVTEESILKAPLVEVKDASALTELYIFLRASYVLFDESLQDAIRTEVDKIVSTLTDFTEPDISVIAATTFRLEQQFERVPELARQEEVISRLNLLQKAVTRRHIAEKRGRLAILEQSGDEASVTTLLLEIGQLETMLRQPPYSLQQLFGKKD